MIDETLRSFVQQDVPPTGLRAEDVLAGARRRTHRRRAGWTVGSATLAVLALLGGVAVVRSEAGGGPVDPATPARAPRGCRADAVPLPKGVPDATLIGVDPTGRYLLGDGGLRSLLWNGTATLDLPTDFSPQAVNSAGLVIGTKGTDPTKSAVTTRGGAEATLPLPAGASGAEATAVNGRGDVAGIAHWSDGQSKAVVWRAGTPVRATVLGGDGSAATSITDEGVVVGSTGGHNSPVRWTVDGATQALPLLPGLPYGDVVAAGGDWAAGYLTPYARNPEAHGTDPVDATTVRWNLAAGTVEVIRGIKITLVSASGTIAGLALKPGATAIPTLEETPVIWRDGRLTALPLPNEHIGAYPAGITADGHTIVGTIFSNVRPIEPVRWHSC